MTEFSKLVEAVNSYHINPDGSFRLDSLGRRRHINQSKGRQGAKLDEYYMVRIDIEMKNRLIEKANGTSVSALIRDYIEWGLENDE